MALSDSDAAMLAKMRSNYSAVVAPAAPQSASKYKGRIDKNGATFRALLVSAPKVSKHGKHVKTSFTAVLLSYYPDAVEEPYGKLVNGEPMLAIKERGETQKPFAERGFYKVDMFKPIRMSTFNKCGGAVGDVVKLYKCVPARGTSGDRTFFNCGDVTKLEMNGKEIVDLLATFPRNSFHLRACTAFPPGEYFGGSHVVPVGGGKRIGKDAQGVPTALRGFNCLHATLPEKKDDYLFEDKQTGLQAMKMPVDLKAEQWWPGEENSFTEQEIDIEVCFWPSQMSCLGVTDPQVWTALAPKLFRAAQKVGFVFSAYEDRDRTWNMKVNDIDICPNPNLFGVILKPQAFFIDEVAFVKAAGHQVTADFVRATFPDPNVRSDFSHGNPYAHLNGNVANLNEFTGNIEPLLKNPNNTFFLINETVYENVLHEDDLATFNALKPKQMDAVFQNKKGAKIKLPGKAMNAQIYVVLGKGPAAPTKKRKA